MSIQKKPTSKEKLMEFANLIISNCTHEEIDMLCIALLDANMKCKRKNIQMESN